MTLSFVNLLKRRKLRNSKDINQDYGILAFKDGVENLLRLFIRTVADIRFQ